MIRFASLASMPHDAQAFAAWMGRQMDRRRMSYRQLEAFSGVDHGSIARIRRGAQRPLLETAIRLASVLVADQTHR